MELISWLSKRGFKVMKMSFESWTYCPC